MDTQRTERVVVETDRHRITGTLTLPKEGYRSRLSDFLNQGEIDFLSLVDCIVEPIDGEGEEPRPYIAVSRSQVRMLYPKLEDLR